MTAPTGATVTDPYPKTKQLARGERRYRRLVASPKQWAAIRAEKLDGKPCRLMVRIDGWEKLCSGPLQLHHIVPRSLHGDDTADNMLPLCGWHHDAITRRVQHYRAQLATRLTDAEYAYVVGKLGESALERLFGV